MNKIEYEKHVVENMIRLYCRKKHSSKTLCEECKTLNNYAQERLTKCSFGDSKAACKDCNIHCYSKQMKERIREVMRFSGPRMIFYYPTDFVLHLFKKRL